MKKDIPQKTWYLSHYNRAVINRETNYLIDAPRIEFIKKYSQKEELTHFFGTLSEKQETEKVMALYKRAIVLFTNLATQQSLVSTTTHPEHISLGQFRSIHRKFFEYLQYNDLIEEKIPEEQTEKMKYPVDGVKIYNTKIDWKISNLHELQKATKEELFGLLFFISSLPTNKVRNQTRLPELAFEGIF